MVWCGLVHHMDYMQCMVKKGIVEGMVSFYGIEHGLVYGRPKGSVYGMV